MNQEKQQEKQKNNFFKKLGAKWFSKFFGFEEGVDITNEVRVLHRRNVVIKNIIFVSNLIYSILLFIISMTSNTKTDWFFSLISLPITYAINSLLKKLIFIDKEDMTKQQMAAYVAAFYIFFSSLLIYVRLYRPSTVTTDLRLFETPAYILIFYSIVVISLYQDKKILAGSFRTLLLILTVVHFIWSHQVSKLAEGLNIFQFFPVFFRSPEFSDILLRTLLFILFYGVVYAIVSIGQYMQEERKNELIKRRQVQQDFSMMVSNLFSAVLNEGSAVDNRKKAYNIHEVSQMIAKSYGFNHLELTSLQHYALVHLRYDEIKDILNAPSRINESEFDDLKEKTALGAKIVRRIQLSKKSEGIARAFYEQTNTEHFIREMNSIEPSVEAQIIVLSDIYITLRSPSSFMRPMTHHHVSKLIQGDLSVFFNADLRTSFMRVSESIEDLFNNF